MDQVPILCDQGHWDDIAQYETLVTDHASEINLTSDKRRSTALHLAAYHGRVDIIRLLLQHGANVEATDEKMRTPVHSACKTGEVDAVLKLHEHGVNLNAFDSKHRCPLTAAIYYEQEDLASKLIELGVELDVSCNMGFTPLMWAASYGLTDLVKELLARGASSAPSPSKCSPLHLAAAMDSTEVIALLLDEHGVDIELRGEREFTALLCAASSGALDTVKELLRRGAVVDATDVDSESALHFAITNDHMELFNELIAHGANVNLPVRSPVVPLLLLAVQENRLEMVTQLLNHGANVNLDDNFKEPLRAAIELGYTDIAKLLVSHGADLRRIGSSSKGPLHLAAELGNAPLVEALLAQDPSAIEVVNPIWKTALHFAAGENHLEVVKILLAHGADPSKKDMVGGTAADYTKDDAVLKLLLETEDGVQITEQYQRTGNDATRETFMRALADAEIEAQLGAGGKQKGVEMIDALLSSPAKMYHVLKWTEFVEPRDDMSPEQRAITDAAYKRAFIRIYKLEWVELWGQDLYTSNEMDSALQALGTLFALGMDADSSDDE